MEGKTAIEVTRQSQVLIEMDNLNSAICGVEDVVRDIIERLTMVLTPSPPQGDECKEGEALVPLAGSLRSYQTRVLCLQDSIRDAVNRLEL